MAKSMTVGKRENEKKRLAKREAKLKRKEGRKSTKSSFDDMIAYVDEYGMITSTPPEENIKKQEINVEEIMISAEPKGGQPMGQCKNLRGKFINCYLCLQIHSLWS